MTDGQDKFRAALLDPQAPPPSGLHDAHGRPAVKRFDVYRNNVTVALIEALRAAFPVLGKLIGAQNFDHLAQQFVRAHPPDTPLMMHYGAALPAYLEAFAPLAHIAYLPDVARLELALRRSYHAADPPAFDPAYLGTLSPDALMAATLTLAAPVEIILSPWPLFDIWRFNTEVDAPKPRALAQPVLITRPAFDPEPHALTAPQADWITKIMSGATLGQAQDAASTVDPQFDLTPLLSLLIQSNAIADVKTAKEFDQ